MRNKKVVITRDMEKDFYNLKEMILENVLDSTFIRYINSLSLFRINPQNTFYLNQVDKIIDQIKISENEDGVVFLPDKFEKARFLVLQLDSKKLKDVVDLTNEQK